MTSVVDNKFTILGQKSNEWNENIKESFMDQSIKVNPESII